ncbi:sirohydrochlorin chelatase [Actinoallomurus soli]|uniref:sirohydrochlorin chelatase n=1 Tax=Actinoallomurus soli TaxID=2952535 RepID=UPI0020921CDD|nr:sirohydrochlorin chelatase [Actinoallomurus soli]MCO5971199.1 sirohydrochlorin chelatase [Actinoallomurus soli]
MTLLAVGHGTRDPAGVDVIRALLERLRTLRPGLTVAESYAEITEPSLEDALAALPTGSGPVVAVPLMLGRGYHTLVDIPGRVGPSATVARPLGPHPLLAGALADRLGRDRHADAVVLGAAGTSDPQGIADAASAARLLGRRLRRPVAYGLAAGAGPDLAEVVRDLRARGARRVAVASYLLAPGHFHDRLLAAGADAVAPPLGVHDALARVVLRRYDEALTTAGEKIHDRRAATRAG